MNVNRTLEWCIILISMSEYRNRAAMEQNIATICMNFERSLPMVRGILFCLHRRLNPANSKLPGTRGTLEAVWNTANRKCNVYTFQGLFAAGMNRNHLSVVLFLDALVLNVWVVEQENRGAGEAGIGVDVVFNVIFVDSNNLACVDVGVFCIPKTCP